MYIERELENQIFNLLEEDEVLSIIGPRQVGKTTLLQHALDKINREKKLKSSYITFEDRESLSLFQDEKGFKRYYEDNDLIIIDEFQYAEDGGQKLKYLYDTTDIKFIISGSSSLDLVFQTGKYMVGRMINLNLWPFSFREFLKSKDKKLYSMLNELPEIPTEGLEDQINKKIKRHFEEYLIFGGYPRAVLTESEDKKKKIIKNIVDLYLTKEIESLLKLATEDELMDLASALSSQIGGLMKYTNLSDIVGLNHLNILQKTYLADFIRPYFSNKQTELSKAQVPYFIDSGFRNYLIDDFRDLEKRDDRGQLVENFVFMSLKREEYNPIKYWRTKS
ncbi:MAG: ATP-binding protein, partial [Flavobacteriales bacterium]